MSSSQLSYYKSLDYNIIIKLEVEENEKWYVAYCEEFGVSACHGIGKTQQEALESFNNEKDAFINFLYETKLTIPEPQVKTEITASGTFTIRTSPWIHSLLIKQSVEFDVSLNAYVNQLLAYGLGNNNIARIVEKKLDRLSCKFAHHSGKILSSINSLDYKKGNMHMQISMRTNSSNQYDMAV